MLMILDGILWGQALSCLLKCHPRGRAKYYLYFVNLVLGEICYLWLESHVTLAWNFSKLSITGSIFKPAAFLMSARPKNKQPSVQSPASTYCSSALQLSGQRESLVRCSKNGMLEEKQSCWDGNNVVCRRKNAKRWQAGSYSASFKTAWPDLPGLGGAATGSCRFLLYLWRILGSYPGENLRSLFILRSLLKFLINDI